MTEYIKREDALKFQDELEPCFCRSAITGEAFIATKDADLVQFLQNISAEDVRPVVYAAWVPSEYPGYLTCSNCHDAFVLPDWPTETKWLFCPQCGAAMRNSLEKVEANQEKSPEKVGADMRGGGGNE